MTKFSRVSLLSAEDARKAAEQCGIAAPLADLNIFRALLHQPPVAKALSDLLLAQLFQGSLDARLRELVIMRIGWATGSDYEWTQHWHIAQDRFGVSAEELLALRDWKNSDLFGEAETAVLAATDDVLERGAISVATWRRCESVLETESERLELVTAIGTWHLISQVTRSLEVPLEEGVASWPPNGDAPSRILLR